MHACSPHPPGWHACSPHPPRLRPACRRWIEPKQARYGRRPRGTTGPSSSAYSGVLECPCTGRYGGSPFYYPGAGTKVNGSLCEAGGLNCNNFTKNCKGAWDGNPAHEGGELITTANPTCWSSTYAGGLSCCGHKRILLDADQDPGPTLLRYHMKWRFWFQEYKPAAPAAPAVVASAPSHYDLPRFYYQTEGWAGEYDIPPAFRGVGDPLITGYECAMCPQSKRMPPPRVPLHMHDIRTLRCMCMCDTHMRTRAVSLYGGRSLPISTPGAMHTTPGSTCVGSCPDGPDCECEHKITYNWAMGNATMLYAGGHCHGMVSTRRVSRTMCQAGPHRLSLQPPPWPMLILYPGRCSSCTLADAHPVPWPMLILYVRARVCVCVGSPLLPLDRIMEERHRHARAPVPAGFQVRPGARHRRQVR